MFLKCDKCNLSFYSEQFGNACPECGEPARNPDEDMNGLVSHMQSLRDFQINYPEPHLRVASPLAPPAAGPITYDPVSHLHSRMNKVMQRYPGARVEIHKATGDGHDTFRVIVEGPVKKAKFYKPDLFDEQLGVTSKVIVPAKKQKKFARGLDSNGFLDLT